MKNKKIIGLLSIMSSLLIFSCASQMNLSSIKELKKNELKGCEIGEHIKVETDSGDERIALKELKQRVLKSKNDSYYIDETIQNGSNLKINATSFTCNKKEN
jgi:hypothetical protein